MKSAGALERYTKMCNVIPTHYRLKLIITSLLHYLLQQEPLSGSSQSNCVARFPFHTPREPHLRHGKTPQLN